MANKKNNKKTSSKTTKEKIIKENNTKQNIKNNTKLSNERKRKFEIIGFIGSIILLVLVLFVILKINTQVKSETTSIMNNFNEAYKSDEKQIIFYYKGLDNDSDENSIEQQYLIGLSKQYNIKYIDIDSSKLNAKNRDEIESKLGIGSTSPSIVIVQNEKIVAVQEGFTEIQHLINLLEKVEILEEGSKYKEISNLKFINYEEYKKLLSKDKINVVIVGKAACKYCLSVKPILNNISKAYKKEFKYLDLSDLSKEDATEFFDEIQKIGYDNEKLKDEGIFSTPTVLLIKKNKIISYIEGAKTLEEYIEYLKENKAIE